MTGIPAKEFGYGFSGNSDIAKNGVTEKSINEFSASFTKMMSNNSVTKSSEVQNKKTVSKDTKNDTTESLAVTTNKKEKLLNDKTGEVSKYVNKKEVSASDDETMNAETIDETAVLKKADEVIAMIAEQLGITEEEVSKAMECLGLTMADLLDVGKLPALMVELSQEADMLSFATNEQLYQNLQNVVSEVEDMVRQLKSDANLSDEEWNIVMNKIQNDDFGSVIKNSNSQNPVNLQQPQLSETATDELSKTSEEDAIAKVFKGNQEIIMSTTDTNEEGEKISNVVGVMGAVSEEETNLTKTGKGNLEITVEGSVSEQHQEEAVLKTAESGTSNQNGTDQPQNGNNMFQNFMNPTTAIEEAMGKTQIPVAQADVEKIIQQINDHLKLKIKDGVTQMQMELHPASLGTVNLHIASNHGVITAAFTAQNEAVKQVLESQIVVLRENLEQAGVKVEAIEVTVESHAFERNLQQQNQSGNNEEQAKKRSTRRINVNELSDEEDSLEEADLLAKKIMEANGNKVDYTA